MTEETLIGCTGFVADDNTLMVEVTVDGKYFCQLGPFPNQTVLNSTVDELFRIMSFFGCKEIKVN